ncbi:hypothetical protein [Lentzea albidocapillata]|uniref:Lipoprotein n=1 Tax=Lentzea albidocapillata TaxID=40571 RepID=A0A1W2FID0_9PSEU|nr:hypothetical protein [Lentzea albidocapillata]SMD21543.1 hypothetical protein SAMN05660733_06458 [Lentzea albidocapillata]
MKNAIKIAFVVAVATVGIAACTAAPEASRNTAAVTAEPLPAPPSPTVVTEFTTVTVTNPPRPDAFVKVDTRLGYGPLKLGMTLEEARAAGLTDMTWESRGDGFCVADDRMAISKKYGVVRITLPTDAKTSKGIGVGSTFIEVKNAYPDAFEYRNGMTTSIDDNAAYTFRNSLQVTDAVVGVRLESKVADCVSMLL